MLIKTACPFYFYLSWKGIKKERERKGKKGQLALNCNKYAPIAPRPLCLLLCKADKSHAD